MSNPRKRTVRWTTKAGEQRERVAWEATFWDRAGKRHRTTKAKKIDAERWLKEQITRDGTGTFSPPSHGRQTVETYVDGWRARQIHRDSTAQSFEIALSKHILPAIGRRAMSSITGDDVQALVKSWTATAAPATVRQRYSVLSMVMKAAVRSRVIPVSPCEGTVLPRLAEKSDLVPITTDVVLALADEILEPYRALVLVGAGTGMRRGEITGLTMDKVSVPFRSIRVDRQLARTFGPEVVFGPTKTPSSVRTIPVAPFVLEAIDEHTKKFGLHSSGLVFMSSTRGPLRPATLQSAWATAAKKVGTDATPHDLRHYFASVQIRAGQSIKVLQGLLGHKSATETLDTYGHLMGDEDDMSRQAIQAALGGLEIASAAKLPQVGTRGA